MPKNMTGMVAKGKTKVLVIGLDGATFDLLAPWMKEGKLPTLARLMKDGVSGKLTSVFPPISPSAWASFITGKNPGKHGVMDFERRREGSYERTVVDPNLVDGKTLWSILSESGRKVGVTYVPFAPVDKVNGFIIPGVFSPAEVSAYPADLEKELMEEIPNYEVTRKFFWQYVPGTEDEYLKKIKDITSEIEDVTLHLMGEYSWDFFMTTFFYGDQLQHFMWRHMGSQHPAYDSKEAKKYGDSILEYYQQIDNALDKILKKIDAHTIIIIMSDHGAGPVHKCVYINHWLMKKNLLKLRETSKRYSLKRYIFRQLTRKNVVDIFLKKTTLEILSKIKSPAFFRSKYYKILNGSRPTFSDVDWTQTKAYSAGGTQVGQIFINLRGREPAGIVKPGKEYEELRNFLVRELLELRDPENNEKIVDKVFKREEIYQGPYTDQAADLIFPMKGMTYYTHERAQFGPDPNKLTEPAFYVNMDSATHRMNGILAVTGPYIKKNTVIDDACILDLAPTILHIWNIPVPSDMDGRVLKEIFELGSDPAEREIKYAKPSKKKVTRRRLSREEEKQLEERLRALGYLG